MQLLPENRAALSINHFMTSYVEKQGVHISLQYEKHGKRYYHLFYYYRMIQQETLFSSKNNICLPHRILDNTVENKLLCYIGFHLFLVSYKKSAFSYNVTEYKRILGGAYRLFSADAGFCQLFLAFFFKLKLSTITNHVSNNSI